MAPKIKVAILGGGPSSLTTAYWLSSTPALRERYDLHVYQMGWRLGGKGASGRGVYNRIEEHGLHILFGCYYNFFSMMREVYGSIERPPSCPVTTFNQAFYPHSFAVIEHFFQGRWEKVQFQLPRNYAVAGLGTGLNSSGAYFVEAVQVLIEAVAGSRTLSWLQQWCFPSGRAWNRGRSGIPRQGEADFLVNLAVALVHAELELLNKGVEAVQKWAPRLLELLSRLRAAITQKLLFITQCDFDAWLLVTSLDSITAMLIGIIVDKVYAPGGLAGIDQYDFAKWLESHGMQKESDRTPFVQFIYDAAFSYFDGVSDGGERISAGTTIGIILRMGLAFDGAAYYKMQGGMGDIVFAPLYQLLCNRGVNFHFFHKVESLHLDPGAKFVQSIKLSVQAKVKDPARGYVPLFDVKGLPSWPAEPLWDQLQDAEYLKQFNLESYYSGYIGEPYQLECGRDFDKVVYGAPISTVSFLCQELLAASPKWRTMRDRVMAIQTVACQAWLTGDLRQLGWNRPSPLLSLFVDPLNTWADMSQVLDRETWPPGYKPKGVSYFCGGQPGPTFCPPVSDKDFPNRYTEKARLQFASFLYEHMSTLLPGTVNPLEPPHLDWNVLVDPDGHNGRDRFDAQYFRSNCEPHERCTLSLPDTNQHRLDAGDTDFSNLIVTGDWIKNGLYAACMEGAIVSGVLAARAVSGEPFPIIAELDY